MKYKKILLTGATGMLGQAITQSGYFQELLTPPRNVLDITKPELIEKFFLNNDIDSVIHCAALARLKESEDNPIKAIETNIIGTNNLIKEVLKKETKLQIKIRFIHISTDGVYTGTKGNYSETDETIPCNKYGWTKLGAECAVNLLSNFCIIRTRFFEPNKINFDKSAIDAYTSKIPVSTLAKAIAILIDKEFIGTINIGGDRVSDYQAYKEHKPSLRPCKFEEILKETNIPMTRDVSMDSSLWKSIQN